MKSMTTGVLNFLPVKEMQRMTTMTMKATALALALLGTMTPALAEQKVALKDPFQIEIENWRGRAFYEILFMNRQADGSGVGFYYNSLGLDLEASNDVMDARFRTLDADTLKKEYGSDGVIFNGPRRLVVNSITGLIAWDGGKKRVIDTIPYRVLGLFEDKAVSEELPAYQVVISKRSNSFKFNAGETVYELITPKGNVYTMFSLSLKIDPKNTIENLPTLGERLKLPEGWKFRSRKLDQDMILTCTADSTPPNTIVLDELVGNYQYNADASQQTTPADPKVLADGIGAKNKRFDNLHGVRYIELFLAGREAKTGKMVAACYNTMFSSKGIPASKDASPQELVKALDMDKLKQEYGLINASLNGPKLWQPDWIEVEVGKERNFGGMPQTWVAQLNVSDKGGIGEDEPYKPMTIARKSGLGWTKGTTALLLDDAEGNTWIMKGFQQGITPKYTYEEFIAAGQSQFKKLPSGWKFRVKVLEKDLIERPENGVATIMPDEFFNIYDKTGPGMTNYKP